jgi:hypothetical protein
MAHRIIADPRPIGESKTDKIRLIGRRRESIAIEPRQHNPVAQIPSGESTRHCSPTEGGAQTRKPPARHATHGKGPATTPRSPPCRSPRRINSRHHAKAQDIAGKVFRIGSGRHGQTMARDRSAYAGVYRVGWLAKCWPEKERPNLRTDRKVIFGLRKGLSGIKD